VDSIQVESIQHLALPEAAINGPDNGELVVWLGRAIGYPAGRNRTIRKLIADGLQFGGAAADPVEPHDGEPSRPAPSPATGGLR